MDLFDWLAGLFRRRSRGHAVPAGWHPPHWRPEFAQSALALIHAHFPSHGGEKSCYLSRGLTSILGELSPHMAECFGGGPPSPSGGLQISCNPGTQLDCVSVPREGTVVVNHGFMYATYQSAALVAARMKVEGDTSEHAIGVDDLSLRLRRILDGCSSESGMPPVISLQELTELQQHFSAFLTYWAESFAVAHEIGHVILERHRASHAALDETRRIVKAFASHGTIAIPKVADWEDAWSEELACDHAGLVMAMSAAISKIEAEGPEKAGIAAGPPAGAGLILGLLDLVRPLSAPASATHPPAELRRVVLRERFAAQGLLGASLWDLSDACLAMLRALAA